MARYDNLPPEIKVKCQTRELELARLYAKSKLGLLIGAGVSASVGFPPMEQAARTARPQRIFVRAQSGALCAA